jgi:hypothetical protein
VHNGLQQMDADRLPFETFVAACRCCCHLAQAQAAEATVVDAHAAILGRCFAAACAQGVRYTP